MHLDYLRVLTLHYTQAMQQVRNLGLYHIHHRVVPEASIGADEQEHVGETRDSRSQVSGRVRLPASGKRLTIAPVDIVGQARVGYMATGAADDRIELALLAIDGHDAVCRSEEHT